MFGAALQLVDLEPPAGGRPSGLIDVRQAGPVTRPDEGAVVRDVAAFPEVGYVFFRRFNDGRSSQPAAFVVDNSSERWSEAQLAELHKRLWLHGVAKLVYIAWPARVDILSCARGPDFWRHGDLAYNPAEQIGTAAEIDAELRKRRRFSASRLADGTFWEDPASAPLASNGETAHESLIQACVEADGELRGDQSPALRRLLLLTVLIKYLEDRRVFPSGWFGRFHRGARTFFQVLQGGAPDDVRRLLGALERKFNGDIFALPGRSGAGLTRSALRKFARLVEARTLARQRYLWEQYSFEHLPVEVISHLYQRFVHGRGTVYTPPLLASLLLDHALPYEQLEGDERILDPACGSGVFLVGAFRRLVNLWRSRHGWRRPDVATLKGIVARSLFGVELQPGALDLAAFSLSLAICDALKPNVIWRELRFEPLRGYNLIEGDFFDYLGKGGGTDRSPGLGAFDVIVGNPPFESQLTAAGQRVDRPETEKRGRLPDKQSAYLFLEQSIPLLKAGGRLCLLQPSGFLYNRKASEFRRQVLKICRVATVLDFTSIRNLYEAADTKTVAVLARKAEPSADGLITHLTFRRTFAAHQRIVFEIDHYDRHRVPQVVAENDPYVWRANLLGGGRLVELSERLRSMRTLKQLVRRKEWILGEGFIVGKRTQAAPFLTGKPFLPTAALASGGIDESQLGVVKDKLFERPRRPGLFQAPLVLIREHDSLPAVFRSTGELAYKHEIVGIHAPPTDRKALKRFFNTFQHRLRLYQLCCTLGGSRALVNRATAILKSDIEALPFPEDAAELDLVFWETALQDDVLDHMVPYVRLGQSSELLQKAAGARDLAAYADMLCRLLGSVYDNLHAAPPSFLDGLICQPFYFGDAPKGVRLHVDSVRSLEDLVYDDGIESLRTVRVLRFYHENVMLVVKPDRLRYWIRSTAIRDADDTLLDLHRQGY